MSELLTREQAANHLNMKKATLECWAWKGIGPDMVKFGKTVRYRLSDLESYITSQTRRNNTSKMGA